MAHLEPISVIHVFEGGKERSEVQTVDDKITPYRVVFRHDGRFLTPRYFRNLDQAIDSAKRFAFHPRSPAKTPQSG